MDANALAKPLPIDAKLAWMRWAKLQIGDQEVRDNTTIVGWAKSLGGWIANYVTNAVTALGQPALGIVAEDVTVVGAPSSIVRLGDAFAVAGAAIPFGALVKGNAAGQLIPAVAGDATIGRAESTASGPGDTLFVFVFPGKM